jgi:hypothetical protein
MNMPVDLVVPDLQVSLRLDAFAPRAARYHVAQVDRPSPDLRDAIVLLTSELVSRAAQHSQFARGEAVELLAWMPPDVIRVELHAPLELLDPPRHDDWTQYDLLLLDQVADRWAIDADDPSACMWFEIDREAHA